MAPCKNSAQFIKDDWRSCRNLLELKRMAKWCCGGSATIIASATMFLCKGIQSIWWVFHIWSNCSSFSVMWDMKLWDRVYQSTEHSDLLLELEFAVQGFEKVRLKVSLIGYSKLMHVFKSNRCVSDPSLQSGSPLICWVYKKIWVINRSHKNRQKKQIVLPPVCSFSSLQEVKYGDKTEKNMIIKSYWICTSKDKVSRRKQFHVITSGVYAYTEIGPVKAVK